MYLLDVVVAQSTAILKLLAGEDQSLLVRGDAFLVLDLGLDVVDRVGRLDLKGDGLAREGLHEAVISVRQYCFPSASMSSTFSRILLSLRTEEAWRRGDEEFRSSVRN